MKCHDCRDAEATVFVDAQGAVRKRGRCRGCYERYVYMNTRDASGCITTCAKRQKVRSSGHSGGDCMRRVYDQEDDVYPLHRMCRIKGENDESNLVVFRHE